MSISLTVFLYTFCYVHKNIMLYTLSIYNFIKNKIKTFKNEQCQRV